MRAQCIHDGARRFSRAHGFTLVELLVVVVITGTLAALGFASLRKQVNAAQGAEALNVVQSIRAAEERWRAENMMYLDVTVAGSWYPRNPADTPGQQHPFFYDPSEVVHADQANWLALRPIIPGPVRFGYLCNAGVAGTAITAPSAGSSITWPATGDNWYMIEAIGDTDGDGSPAYYRASSLNDEVYVENSGE